MRRLALGLAVASLLGCGPLGDLRVRAWLGDPDAQLSLGRLLEEGAGGLSRDPEAAVVWYLRAAREGRAAHALNAARVFRQGIGVAPDAGATERWLRRAADLGSARGQQLLAAFVLDRARRPEDGREALALAKQAAEAERAEAMFFLAQLYSHGAPGVPRDEREAMSWLLVAAEFGLVDAQRELSERSFLGDGTARDPLAAERWYRAVVERDPAYSQIRLAAGEPGYLLLTGQGSPEDSAAAATWYRERAENGDLVAQWVIGRLLVEGRGAPADPARGFGWIERAACAGYAPARLAFAYAHYRGEGLPRDIELAHAWFRASDASIETAGMLERTRSLLDAEQLERAESLARQIEEGGRRAQEPPLRLQTGGGTVARVVPPHAITDRSSP